MLNSRNSGKYLLGRWVRERGRAMRDADDSDQTYLELSDVDVSGKWSNDKYETETTPVDPLGNPKTRDIRNDPIRGID